MLRTLIKNLYIQVLIAIIFAIIFGVTFPEAAQSMKPLGDGFIKLIKMCIGPVIFCTIVLGINSSKNLGQLGRVGVKTIVYFEILTTIALIIGVIVALIIKPGSGMNIDIASINAATFNPQPYEQKSFVDFLLNIIPTTIFKAFVDGEILPILFIAIIFGIAISKLEKPANTIISAIEDISYILFKIINFIMRLAPIGAFGAMSFTIGKYGAASLLPLINLLICFYITCILFIFIILGTVMKLCDSSLLKLLKFIKEEIFLTLATSSSEAALPNLMHKMEQFGCKKSIVGIVVPSGYSLNLDGSCIYFTMAILFIAQAFNIDLTFEQIFSTLLILLITSKGAAGVTGSGFITLAATLSVVHSVPSAGLALILGIDRFMSEARAVTNIIGNAVATVAIAKIEGEK